MPSTSKLQYHKEQVANFRARRAKSMQAWDSKIQDAERALEVRVTHLVASGEVSLTQAATELGCSRDKVKDMMKRTRERSWGLMQSKSESNARPRCVKCRKYLPGEYPKLGIDLCWKCKGE